MRFEVKMIDKEIRIFQETIVDGNMEEEKILLKKISQKQK
tara:strand:- start:115 stop:234 length:120 start_codon:yes stop_codon:yes gene_type:complete